MLDLCEGDISIAGVNLSTLLSDTVRTSLITIPQALYNDAQSSIRRNANPTGVPHESSVLAALDKVGLGGEVRTQGGIDLVFDTLGLTPGQTKLFGLAKALLTKECSHKDTGVILLDEITASVDEELEARKMGVVREAFNRFTIIAVAHRINSLVGFDRVVVMDAGRIIEVGDLSELMDSPGSAFARLTRTGTSLSRGGE
jgi:ABC-type transport system involved in cytochrome bd biosynthesis fused ATPase/permease subunit